MAKKPFNFNVRTAVKCLGHFKTRNTRMAGCPNKNTIKANVAERKTITPDRCYKCYNVDHPQEGRLPKKTMVAGA